MWVTYPCACSQFGNDFNDIGEVEEFFKIDEMSLLQLNDSYSYDESTKMKGAFFGVDPNLFTINPEYLAYRHGNIRGAEVWFEKVIEVMEKTKKEQAGDAMRILNKYLNEVWYVYYPTLRCCSNLNSPYLNVNLLTSSPPLAQQVLRWWDSNLVFYAW